MPDLFISYSRRNSDFVRKLHKLLADAGKDIWIDFEDIPLSSSWWEEIREGIEAADTFVFVLSPDSVSSPICNFEVAHAVAHNKRIIPIVRQLLDVEDGYTLVLNQRLNDSEVQILGTRKLEEVARETWSSVARHNWLFFSDDEQIEQNFEQLLKVLDTDLSHTRTHTRLLLRAREWENSGESDGLLLTSGETSEAEQWLADSGDKIPHPTGLHNEYIHASRVKHRLRQRQFMVAVSVALVLTIILAIVSIGFFIEAQFQGNLAATSAAEANTQFHIAETNAQNALYNAATATFAQGEAEVNAIEAQVQANLAATSARQAVNNAQTAEFAQSKAEANGTQAAHSADQANTQAAIVETQARLARDSAIQAATAQIRAERNEQIAQTQVAIAQENFEAAATARANSAVSAANAETQAARAEAQATVAESNRREAIRLQDNVAVERDRARSIALAALAETELDLEVNANPERATILALAALERFGITWQANGRWVYLSSILIPQTLLQHQTEVTALELSGDGRWMASSDATGAVLIWDANNFTVVQRLLEHTDRVTTVRFSSDWSRLLTTSHDTTARIWDTESGLAVQRLRGHTESILGGVWSPDATQVLTYSADGDAIIWDVATGAIVMRLNHGSVVRAADWSPDGTLIVTGAEDGLARVWSPDGSLRLTYDGHLFTVRDDHNVIVTAIKFAPNGEMVATGGTDEKIHIWNAQTGDNLTVLEGHVLDISKLIWSGNNLWLASIDGLNANNFTRENASARIWNIRDEINRFAIFDHFGVVNDAAWSPNGNRLATVGTDGFLYISDAASGGQLLGLRDGEPLTVVAWSASGDALITGNAQGAIRVWPYWTSAAELAAYARSCCTPRALTDEEARQFGLPVPTSVPAETVTITRCENGSAAQRLYPGTRAVVLLTGDPAPLNVRNRPSTLGRIEAQIPPGQTFRVISEPTCDDRNPIAWYQIQFGLDAEMGFIAEGVGDEYFVQPLP